MPGRHRTARDVTDNIHIDRMCHTLTAEDTICFGQGAHGAKDIQHCDLGPARRTDWSISGLRSGTTRHDKPTQAKKRRSANPHTDAPALTYRRNTAEATQEEP